MILPSEFIARVFNLTPVVQDSKVSESMGGQRIVEKGVGHRLRFTIETFPLNLEQAYLLAAWRDQNASSQADIFTAKLPIITAQRSGSDLSAFSVQVREAAPAGTTQIKLKGLPSSTQSVIAPFTLGQLSNHTKLYHVGISQVGDVLTPNSWNTNAAGQTTIQLTKPLLKAVPVDTELNLTNAVVTASPLDDSWDFEVSAANDNKVSFTLNCVEHY